MFIHKKSLKILSLGFLSLGIAAFFLAWKEQAPYREEALEQTVLQETVIVPTNETQKKEPHPFERKIDFHSLKKMNEEIVAWIYIPGTSIDYPVLLGTNDSEYLNKNFRGKKSKLGSIFGFSDTAKDFSDAHICLFGHNMRSPQMFGELKKYKKEDFATQHPKLYCYTPEGVTEYELFSVYECRKTDPTFEHKMQKNSEEFFQMFHRMLEKNIIPLEKKSSLELQADGKQIVTLSCCSNYNRTENRMTVHFLETEQRRNE